MLPVSTQTVVTGNGDANLLEVPHFGTTKSIPAWCVKQVEAAVKDFIKTSHLPQGIDAEGFYYQTLEAIAQTTHLNGAGDFWLATCKGRVLVYGLAHIAKDLDQKLCYHISQMWVAKEYRGSPIVKEWWEQIRQRAKDLFCKHLVIVSSRSPKAYMRFLGHGMHPYAFMLKEEL